MGSSTRRAWNDLVEKLRDGRRFCQIEGSSHKTAKLCASPQFTQAIPLYDTLARLRRNSVGIHSATRSSVFCRKKSSFSVTFSPSSSRRNGQKRRSVFQPRAGRGKGTKKVYTVNRRKKEKKKARKESSEIRHSRRPQRKRSFDGLLVPVVNGAHNVVWVPFTMDGWM